MITVAILINGQPIMARSAWNVGVVEDGRCEYAVDDESVIHHLRSDGAARLAIEMLKTIKEGDRHVGNNLRGSQCPAPDVKPRSAASRPAGRRKKTSE